MNVIEDGSKLLKWKSVEKTSSNNSPVYLNPGFEENSFDIKSKKFTSPIKQSPLELLVETCKNIGQSLGLDEPLTNRKRIQIESREEEIGVSGRKKQNLSPASQQSKSPMKLSIPEERKHLKPIINIPVRTTPDSSGSPRILTDNVNNLERKSNFLASSNVLDNSINLFTNVSSNNIPFNKSFSLDSLNSYGIFNNLSPIPQNLIDTPHHRFPCDCFLCLLFSIKPFLNEPLTFPFQSKANLFPSQNLETKSDMILASLFNNSNERQSPLGIEYCMYCGLHCPSIQILLQHIHHSHLL